MTSSATHIHLATLRQRLSEERLRPYDQATRDDHHASLRLYEWNTFISAAFYESLQALEVVLRNAIHEQLTELHARQNLPGYWFDDPTQLLTTAAREDVSRARRRLRSTGKTVTPGRLIAELPFGFWRFMLTARLELSLWRPALRFAFAQRSPLTRDQVAKPLARLHVLRNRIAHHEPIPHHRLDHDWQDLQYVAEALCVEVHAWIRQTSRVPDVLAVRPTAPGLSAAAAVDAPSTHPE